MNYLSDAENLIENPLGFNLQMPPILDSIVLQGGDTKMITSFPNKNSHDGEFAYEKHSFTVFMSCKRVVII
jgi:hypothetical protein